MYVAVAAGDPDKACLDLFADQGRTQFARDFGTSTCDDVVRRESVKVTSRDVYASLAEPLSAVHMNGTSAATVYSCAMDISGGPQLGAFVLANTSNGWGVVGHQPDPTPCPQAAVR